MVLIEHVSPHRELTRTAIAKADSGVSDKDLIEFVRQSYRLVLLTAKQTERLNKLNRSKMVADRLEQAGITIVRAD